MKTALQKSLAVLVVLAAANQAPAAALNSAGVLERMSAIGAQLLPGAPAPAALPPPAVLKAAPAVPAPAGVSAQGRTRPDLSYSPGKLCTTSDPDYKELRYPEQIAYCQRHVTKAMKLRVAAHYGVPESEWHNYEFDHLIPLGIGGNSSVENLWPQPRGSDESDGKDVLENRLYQQLKDGTITQAEAVRQNMAWFDQMMLRRAAAGAAAR
jgi:hypothetical protein